MPQPSLDQIVQAVMTQITTDLFPCSRPGKRFYERLKAVVRIGAEKALQAMNTPAK